MFHLWNPLSGVPSGHEAKRRKSLAPALGASLVAVLSATALASAAFVAGPEVVSADHVCSDVDAKVESGGNDNYLEYTTPADQTVEAVCIKAGNNASDRLERNGNYDLDYNYLGSGTAECYFTVDGIGTQTVSVTRNEGGGRGCAGTGSGLSNMEIYYTTGTPTATSTPQTPTSTSTPQTPTSTSTPQTPTATSTSTRTPTPETATPTETAQTATVTTATTTATPTDEVLAEVAVLSVEPPTTGSGGLLGSTSRAGLGLGIIAANALLLLLVARARAAR